MYHISLAYAGTPAHNQAHEAEVRLLGSTFGGLSYTPNSNFIVAVRDDDGSVVATASYCSGKINDKLLVQVAAATPPVDLEGRPYKLKDMVEYGDRMLDYSRVRERSVRLDIAHHLNAVIILSAQQHGARAVLGVGSQKEFDLFRHIGLDTESIPVNQSQVEQTFFDPYWGAYFKKERFVHYAHILPDEKYESMRQILRSSQFSMSKEIRCLESFPNN